MIRTFAFLGLVACTFAGTWSPGLKVRFDITGFGRKSFMSLPQSASDAVSRGWVSKERPTSPTGLEALTLWCPSTDYAVCILTDDTDYIAGLQIALDIDNYSDGVFDMEVQGFTPWTAELNDETKNYWSAQMYFISASALMTDPQSRIANRDQSTILQEGDLWVSGINGELSRISGDITELTSDDSIYTKQACIPLMGRHYYYNMSSETECKSDAMSLWFPLIQSNQLIGVGFVGFGKMNIPAGQTNWFEAPTRSAVQVIVPNGPDCLYDLIDSAGAVTMHTYFIEYPLLVNCVIQ